MRIAMIGQKGIETGEKGGGIERHVEEISKRLAARGHDVFVYARRRAMPGKGTKIVGVHIMYLPTLYRKNFEAIVHAFLSTVHALFGSYDIVHYHGVGPATLAWIPRLFLSHTKVIVTFHSQDRFHTKWSIFARWYLFLGEWAAVTFPHACIAVSHVIQVFCRERFHRRVRYIPNGAVPTEVKTTGELARFGLVPQGYLLFVGRIVPHKGLSFLLDAYEALEKTGRDLPDLVIVGAPSFTDRYFRELKRRTAGHPRIHWLGFQNGRTLAELFAHAKLFIYPSEAEGLPLVILEAMSYGLPVLASDISENLEAMHHAGFSFRVRDVDDLSAKLSHLLAHPAELRAAREATQKIVRQFFDWDKIVTETERVYEKVRRGAQM